MDDNSSSQTEDFCTALHFACIKLKYAKCELFTLHGLHFHAETNDG